MYRFNEALGEIAGRNLQPLTKIREKDQLKGLSDSLTQMAETLAADYSEIKDKISRAKTLLPKEGSPDELREKLDEMEGIISKYKI